MTTIGLRWWGAILLGLPVLITGSLTVGRALAVTPGEYLYGAAQTSNFTITNHAKINAAQLRLVGVYRTKQNDTLTISVDGMRHGVQGSASTLALGPTLTSGPTPTPTPIPPTGTTDIEPYSAQDAYENSVVAYTHTVAHIGSSFDYKNITAISSQGWSISLYLADGVTPLTDHNFDGIPDTDRLNAGQSTTIVVKVAVPTGVATGTMDQTTVTASSGRNPAPANNDSVIDTSSIIARPPGPTPTPSPTPTPTPAPPSGTTDINPNNRADANPGAIVAYMHTVTHTGVSFDTKDITYVSSRGWTSGLYAADGVTPLTDTNGNGIVDTGRLSAGQSVTIVVKVSVPAGTLAGTQDVTTVTANSGRNPSPANSYSVTDITTVKGVLSISMSAASVTFGFVGPTGEVDPAVTGVTSTTNASGAYYVKSAAQTVTVTSNAPWTGYCRAGENTGPAGIFVTNERLEWRLVDDATWRPFSVPAYSAPYDNTCFASRRTGANTYQYEYRLRVDWTDDPGTFSVVVNYVATQ